jgi:hypothetical protein
VSGICGKVCRDTERRVDGAEVETMRDTMIPGDDSRNYQVWTLYAFALWCRNVYGAAARSAVA